MSIPELGTKKNEIYQFLEITTQSTYSKQCVWHRTGFSVKTTIHVAKIAIQTVIFHSYRAFP